MDEDREKFKAWLNARDNARDAEILTLLEKLWAENETAGSYQSYNITHPEDVLRVLRTYLKDEPSKHSDAQLDTAREVRQGMIDAQAKGGGKGLMNYLLGKDDPTQNRVHQDCCGLDLDHKGPCVATFTRDIGTRDRDTA